MGEAPKRHAPTGFFTDTTVCIGCKACEVACKQWNQLPSDGFNWSGNSYDNTAELSATTWRHVKFIEQFSPEISSNLAPLNLAALEAESNETLLNRWLMMSDHCKHCVAALAIRLAPPAPSFKTSSRTSIFRRTSATVVPVALRPAHLASSRAATWAVIRINAPSAMTASATVWSRPAPRACPTQSIQFGPVDELRERARKRVEELHQRGVPQAHLYGDVPSETYSEMHSFYLLVDRPSVYGLPDAPFNPWLHMMGDYVRSVAGGLAAVAVLLAVVFL